LDELDQLIKSVSTRPMADISMERIIDQTEKGFPDHDENVAVHLAFSERRKSSKKERNTDKTE